MYIEHQTSVLGCDYVPSSCVLHCSVLFAFSESVRILVVSLFLQCMGFVQHEGCTIPCTVKIVRHLTCTDRPSKANRQAPNVYTVIRTVRYLYSIKYGMLWLF